MDAIGDFTVQQTPSAEFGVKGGAAINVVMKSGGNVAARHRLLLPARRLDRRAELLRQARGAAAARGDATPIKNQQYGGTFGGPIQKDKTFFFGYYEGQRLAVTSPYVVHVPTRRRRSREARARIAAAGLQTNPIGENLLKFYPTDPTGQPATSTRRTSSNMNTFSVKVDHQLNANNLINERVFYGRNFQSAPAGNSGEIVPPNGPSTCSTRSTDPTHRVRWSASSGTRRSPNRTLLETRVRLQPTSRRRSSRTTRSIRKSLGINTGPLDAEDLGVPGVTTPFGHIGGVGGYPITTAPTTTTQVSAGADADARRAHVQDRRQLGLRLQPQRPEPGAHDADRQRPDQRRRRRAGRPAAGAGSRIAARSFGQTERHMSQTLDRRLHQRRLEGDVAPHAERRPALRAVHAGQRAGQPGHELLPRPRAGAARHSGLDQLYKADKNNFGPRAGLAWDRDG